MNLWGNRMGQLTALAVALFFFSCEDETSLLGYKNPTSKFNLSYIDIPVESSVILLDSVRTSNFNAGNDVNRLLVGNCSDPVMGDVNASFFTQFVPTSYISSDDSLVFDSVSVQLRLDYYAYGTAGETYQKIQIHEVTEALNALTTTSVTSPVGGQQTPQETSYYSQRHYFNKSTAAYDPTPLAVKGFKVDMETFNESAADATPDTTLVQVKLNNAFGLRLFNLAKDDSVSWGTPSTFVTKFFGLAITPDASNDKIVGFNPAEPFSKLTLHYHILKGNGTNKDTLQVNFSMARANVTTSFNKIISDRSGTDLASLTNPYEEFTATDNRYIQSGTAIATKLDLSGFVQFADTVTRLAVNSAELLIKNVDDPNGYAPPQSLIVKILDDNNRFQKPAYPGRPTEYQNDADDMNLYRGTVNFDRSISTRSNAPFDSTYNIVNDIQGFFALTLSDDEKKYSGTSTLFFQELFARTKAEGDPLFTKVALIPYEAPAGNNGPGRHIIGKTINRVAFHKDDIVLRVYYTTPRINN
jgi:hypothetical protein